MNENFMKNLLEMVTVQCKNNFQFESDIRIQGMLAVTTDSKQTFLIPFDERYSNNISQTAQPLPADANDDYNTYQFHPTNQMNLSYTDSQKFEPNGPIRGVRRARRQVRNIPTTPKNKNPPRAYFTPQPKRLQNQFLQQNLTPVLKRRYTETDSFNDDSQVIDSNTPVDIPKRFIKQALNEPGVRRVGSMGLGRGVGGRGVVSMGSRTIPEDSNVESVTILSDNEEDPNINSTQIVTSVKVLNMKHEDEYVAGSMVQGDVMAGSNGVEIGPGMKMMGAGMKMIGWNEDDTVE